MVACWSHYVDEMLSLAVVLWALHLSVARYILTHGFVPLVYSGTRYLAAAFISAAYRSPRDDGSPFLRTRSRRRSHRDRSPGDLFTQALPARVEAEGGRVQSEVETRTRVRHELKGEPRMIRAVRNIVKRYKRPGLSTRGWTL